MWIYLIPVNPWVFEHTGVTTLAPPSWGAPEYTAMSTWEKKLWMGSEGERMDTPGEEMKDACTHVFAPLRGENLHLSFSATHWESLASDSCSLLSPQWLVLVRSPSFSCLKRQHFFLLDTDLASWPGLPVSWIVVDWWWIWCHVLSVALLWLFSAHFSWHLPLGLSAQLPYHVQHILP